MSRPLSSGLAVQMAWLVASNSYPSSVCFSKSLKWLEDFLCCSFLMFVYSGGRGGVHVPQWSVAARGIIFIPTVLGSGIELFSVLVEALLPMEPC